MSSKDKIEDNLANVLQWIEEKVPMLTIAKRLGVTITTLHRYVHKNGLARSKQETSAISSATTKAQWANGRLPAKKPYREPMTPKPPVEQASHAMAYGESEKAWHDARDGSARLLAAQIAAGIVWRAAR